MSRFSKTVSLSLAKGPTGTTYAMVNLCISDCSCGEKVAKVSEVVYIVQGDVVHTDGCMGGSMRCWLM